MTFACTGSKGQYRCFAPVLDTRTGTNAPVMAISTGASTQVRTTNAPVLTIKAPVMHSFSKIHYVTNSETIITFCCNQTATVIVCLVEWCFLDLND